MARSPRPTWPEPVELINRAGKSEIVLLCEHASNYIPHEYEGLGLHAADLERHIAWDIGAAELTRRLSARLDAPAFLGCYSRLLIDLNRPLDAPGSIPVRSEETDIPKNMELDGEERSFRVDKLFRPFHLAIEAHLADRQKRGLPTCIVSVHSFTPVFIGQARPWHAGVLYGQARGFGEMAVELLRTNPGLVVAANVPYVISHDGDYAVPVHGDHRGLPAILLEIRQDLLADNVGIDTWTDRLTAMLKARPWETRAGRHDPHAPGRDNTTSQEGKTDAYSKI